MISRFLVSSLLISGSLGGCLRSTPIEAVVPAAPAIGVRQVEEIGRCRENDPLRTAFFGELHVHTQLSLDAHLQGNRITPSDAYRFARGERIGVQPYDDRGRALRSGQLERPLDFAAVTDHAEFLGVVDSCIDPNSPTYGHIGCRRFRSGSNTAFLRLNAFLAWSPDRLGYPRLCGEGAGICLQGEAALWVDTQNAAETFYDRSEDCRFTTFVGYEWTASPMISFANVANLHRNVIFRNNIVPALPAGYLRTHNSEALFSALEEECIDAGTGCDVLVIPHNANLSDGQMFLAWDGDERSDNWTQSHAIRRARFESIHEIIQHKGASECVPFGSMGDEACGFELVPYLSLSQAKRDQRNELHQENTLRHGLSEGLRMGRDLGANPFEVGLIGSTDSHLGLPGAVEEFAFLGGGGAGEAGGDGLPDRVFFSGGGLAAIWAEENSREALFSALRRREVYGTSGTRIRVRTFMGDGIPDNFCELRNRAQVGYTEGVPMGSRLGEEARAPRLAIVAQADTGTEAHPGAPLQMVEVIKGVLRPDGTIEVTVIQVAGNPTLGMGRDPYDGCEAPTVGAGELCAVWEDPVFDPASPAYYYVRVLEVPTCRWSTLQCLEEPLDCDAPNSPRQEACCEPVTGLNPPECASVFCRPDSDNPCCVPHRVQPMIRERAWSSPIYTGPRPSHQPAMPNARPSSEALDSTPSAR